jgi:hypothetical protein
LSFYHKTGTNGKTQSCLKKPEREGQALKNSRRNKGKQKRKTEKERVRKNKTDNYKQKVKLEDKVGLEKAPQLRLRRPGNNLSKDFKRQKYANRNLSLLSKDLVSFKSSFEE